MKISVITTVFNAENTIRKCLDSLYSQTYKNFEHIIYDSCSTDNTIKIIKEFEYNNNLKIFIKKDDGIFYGMNNCLSKVSGDLFFFLNADDYLVNNKLFQEIFDNYSSKFDCISTKIKHINHNGKITRIWNPPKKLNNFFFPSHNGTFYGSYFLKYKFDCIYKISSDFKYVREICFDKNINYKSIKSLSIYQLTGGNSTSLKNFFKKVNEDLKILKEAHKYYFINYFMKIIHKLLQIKI